VLGSVKRSEFERYNNDIDLLLLGKGPTQL